MIHGRDIFSTQKVICAVLPKSRYGVSSQLEDTPYLDLIYNVTWNVIVLPACFAEVFPPWASTVALTMERPIPVPLTAPEWDSSAR